MEEIIRKIRDMYFRYGLKSVTMDDLAHELGISKKTLYETFADKEDVVKRVMESIIRDHKAFYESISADPGSNAIDELLHLTRYYADYLKSVNPTLTYDLKKFYPALWDQLIHFKSTEIYNQILANSLKGVNQAWYRNDINHEVIAYVYVARLDLFSPGSMPDMDKFSYHDVFMTFFFYHVRGIASSKGLEYLETLAKDHEFSTQNKAFNF